MKPENLMNVIGEAQEEYIQSALETRERKPDRRRRPVITKLVLVAAIVLSLATTVYATDFFGLRVTISDNHDRSYSSFRDMPRAMEEAGFQMDSKEAFENGYTFVKVDVCDVRDLDEEGNEERSYTELNLLYKNASGQILLLSTNQNADFPVTPSRQIEGIDVDYGERNLKMYPMEKAGQMTEEDEAWQKQPGNSIGYGSNAGDGVETKITSLHWVKDGILYYLMDPEGIATEEVLCAIAEELITGR